MKGWLLLGLLGLCSATVYFKETFDPSWEERWVQTKHKTEGSFSKFERSAGKWYTDPEKDAGIQTKEDYRFYQASAKSPSFSNKDKPLVLQFTIKNEQYLDCGGGYIKLLPEGFDQENFGGDTPYLVMFGPDICGSEKKTHFILNYNGENYLSKKRIRVETDNFTHQYTAIVYPDNTFKVLIDNEEVESGNIEDNWEMLAPKEISDPSAKKPEDWVDEPTIPDPEDKKPEGWDDIPQFIPDGSAEKPEDWDEEKDGPWSPPQIPNPEYKGEWKPKMIPNPDYKGPWTAPKIPNPDYIPDLNLYKFGKIGGVGIEIWQVTSGSIFDNIFVGDDPAEAKKFSEETFVPRKSGEEAAKAAFDEEEQQRMAASSEGQKEDTDLDFEPDNEDFKEDL